MFNFKTKREKELEEDIKAASMLMDWYKCHIEMLEGHIERMHEISHHLAIDSMDKARLIKMLKQQIINLGGSVDEPNKLPTIN